MAMDPLGLRIGKIPMRNSPPFRALGQWRGVFLFRLKTSGDGRIAIGSGNL